jgi:hypothetical protein
MDRYENVVMVLLTHLLDTDKPEGLEAVHNRKYSLPSQPGVAHEVWD